MVASTHHAGLERRASSASRPSEMYKFPELSEDALELEKEYGYPESRLSSPGPLPNFANLHSTERWQARKDAAMNGGVGAGVWSQGGSYSGATRHGRQKSLSEAIRTVRTRKGSVTQNAHEIAEALKAPVSAQLVILCGVWYATSILSNTSSKAILTALPMPVTLTVVQFAFVCSWCLFASWLAKRYAPIRNALPVLRSGIRTPSREIIVTTLPLTAFQIGGHILNSDAMSRIPVSLVHTIKGLSPLFTVLAYRLFFNVKYSTATYASLIPLTLGVVMACSASLRGETLGLIYAFGSAILFVTQNIVSKKLFNEAARAEADGLSARHRKPDKLNLLCYSSGLALILTLPIWLWSEGFTIIYDFLHDASVELSQRPGSLDHGRLVLEFIFNGTFHFTQSLVAFVLLGLVSPVTYSVASLIKRVFVIVFAVIWFGVPMTRIQGFGISLTILGLYLYDRTSDAAKADRRMREKQAARHGALLPTINTSLANGEAKRSDSNPLVSSSALHPPSQFAQSPATQASPRNTQTFGGMSGYAVNGDAGGSGPGRPHRRSSAASPGHANTNGGASAWLPPGTRQEDTWKAGDVAQHQGLVVR